jgi:integrase
MNDGLLNKRKITRFIPEDEDREEDECYTHQEIQRLLSVSDERIRVSILLMASTGMRIGALPHLQLRDLTKIEQYNLYKIQVYARSMASHHYTFCTPECAAAIDSYLAYRKRFGEPIGLDQKAPLIREQFNINDRFKAKHPKQAKLKTISETIDRIVKKSGIESKGRVRRNHGLRKFAITQMIKAKMDYASREYLVGHRHSRGLDRNYDRTTEEDRLSEFIKAVDLLTISQENRLKLQIHQMKAEHSAEWNQLKEQMAELKKMLENKV